MKKYLLISTFAILITAFFGAGSASAATAPVFAAGDIGASNIAPTSVSLYATPTNTGGATITAASFSYGTSASYGTNVSIPPASINAMYGSFDSSVSGLTCNMLYHYRASATNSVGTTTTGDVVFKTEACGGAPISVTTNGASAITATSAVLSGTLNSFGGDVNPVGVGFLVMNVKTGASQFAISGTVTAAGPFSATLTGLACATSYTYTAYMSDWPFGPVVQGATLTFTTAACPPTLPSVITTAVGTVTATTAVINGAITGTGGTGVNVTPGFAVTGGTVGAITPAAVTTASTPFSATLTGLACATSYTYTAKATNSAGTATAPTSVTFTTAVCPGAPTVITDAATSVTMTSAVLNGHVTALGTSAASISARTFASSTGSVTPNTTPVSTMPSAFSFAATGLICNTAYTYTATATNNVSQTGSGSAVTFTTAPCPVLPAVVTVSATAVTASTATFNGSITSTVPNATTVGFGYNTSVTTTTGTDPAVSTSGSFGAGPFSLNVTGLICNTQYHLRAYATNTVGRGWGGDIVFSTLPCPLVQPSVVTNPATSVGTTTATINGTLTSTGGAASVNVAFQYGLTTSYTFVPTISPGLTATGPFAYSASGLACGRLYHFRATANNGVGGTAGTVVGADLTFTTLACPATAPTVVTDPATSVTTTTAILNGHVVALGTSAASITSRTFTSTTGTVIPTAAIVTTVPAPFSFSASGLSCGTAYTYTATATNNAGLVGSGSAVSFTTLSCAPGAPVVVTDAATSVTTSSAVLNGHVTALGATATSITSRTFASTTGSVVPTVAVATSVPAAFSFAATGLVCGTSYTYTATATNNVSQTGSGSAVTFTTLACPPLTPPTVATLAATSVTAATAIINGGISALGTGGAAATSFKYGLGSLASTASPASPSPIAVAPTLFSYSLTGLSCAMTYQYQAQGANSGGLSSGSTLTFTTLPCPAGAPTVITDAATSVTMTSAVLNGHVTALGTSAASISARTFASSTGSVTPNTTPVSTMPSAFSFAATGLICNTAYTYTATATNNVSQTGSGSAMMFTTAPCPVLPATVVTDTATSVTAASAVINGHVSSLGTGGTAATSFNYGIGSLVSTASPTSPASAVGAPTAFSYALSGLTCATTYSYAAQAANSGGSASGLTLTFTTGACPVGVPTVVTDAAASVTATTAILNGHVTALGLGAASVTNRTFASTTGTVIPTAAIASAVPAPFSFSASGLICNTTYTYTATATNNVGQTASGLAVTFSTSACPVGAPSVTTDPATSVASTTATINGTILSIGTGATSAVRGFTGSFGAAITVVGTATGPGTFSANLTGLVCGTAYTYVASATNNAHTGALGITRSFTTTACPPAPPAIATVAAASITATGAALNGTLTSLGGSPSVSVAFQYGPTATYGTIVPATTVTMTATGAFSKPITGLICGRQYHFQALGTSAAGIAQGLDMTFTTTACQRPDVTTIQPSPVGPTTSSSISTLNGVLNSTGGDPNTVVGFDYGPASAGTTFTMSSVAGTMSLPGNFSAVSPTPLIGPNNIYQVRAKATNSAGTSYGGTIYFFQ